MSEAKPESVRAGSNEFHFIPPDLLHIVFRGAIDDTDAEVYLDFVFKQGDQCNGPLYCVYDITNFTRATEAGRNRVINVGRPYPYAAIALLGANFSTTTIARMILMAGRLIAPKHFNFQHKFVSSLDEANAWFDELRRKQPRS